MCHRANDGTAWQCVKCLYEFGQPIEKVRELLRMQLKTSRIGLLIFALLDLAMIGGVIYALFHQLVLISMPLCVLMAFWTYRFADKVSVSKESLASLERQQAELPKAKVVSG